MNSYHGGSCTIDKYARHLSTGQVLSALNLYKACRQYKGLKALLNKSHTTDNIELTEVLINTYMMLCPVPLAELAASYTDYGQECIHVAIIGCSQMGCKYFHIGKYMLSAKVEAI